MDWGNDYFTLSDTNIEYIWASCARCTRAAGSTRAIARRSGAPLRHVDLAHELSGSDVYRDKTDLSAVRLLPRERDGESLVVWTTTPWTLRRRRHRAVKPDASTSARRRLWSRANASPTTVRLEPCAARSSSA